VPTVLVEGVMAPVELLIVRPVVEEYTPPVVPVRLGFCGVERLLQKGVPG
jgi:hypothetical protein